MLHNHLLTEHLLGLDKRNLVIVDRCYTHLFKFYSGLDEKHIIVSRKDFDELHGKYKHCIADR